MQGVNHMTLQIPIKSQLYINTCIIKKTQSWISIVLYMLENYADETKLHNKVDDVINCNHAICRNC